MPANDNGVIAERRAVACAEKTRSPAKARFGRPYGKNGRLGGHIGETGSRNTAAAQKINS